MRVGHAGVALAAKAVRPRVPFWLFLGAAYGPDILEIGLRVFGNWNRMLSHSLVSVGLCATATALIWYAVRRDWRDAVAIWVVYVLHWPADFVTGIKPTWPGGPWVGLELYGHRVLVWIVDLGVLGLGVLYWRRRRRVSCTARS